MARVLASRSVRGLVGGAGLRPRAMQGLLLPGGSPTNREVCFAYPVLRCRVEGHPHPRNALHVDLGRHVVWRKRACPRRLGGEGVGAAVKWRSVAVVADSSLTKLEFSPWCTLACRCHVARSSSHRWARITSVARPAGLRTGAEVSGCSWFCLRFGARAWLAFRRPPWSFDDQGPRGMDLEIAAEGLASSARSRDAPACSRHAWVGSSLRSPRQGSSSIRVGVGLGRRWLGAMLGRPRSATAAAPLGPQAGRGSGSPESEHQVST